MNKIDFDRHMKAYRSLGADAFGKSHYELAVDTRISDPQAWKEFLMLPEIVDYIASEMILIRDATINKISQNAAGNNSVGQAQLLNALTKIGETTVKKDGPAFIYCYVPPNEQQAKAPNFRQVKQTDKGVYIFEE